MTIWGWMITAVAWGWLVVVAGNIFICGLALAQLLILKLKGSI